jgi:hypothetical protein
MYSDVMTENLKSLSPVPVVAWDRIFSEDLCLFLRVLSGMSEMGWVP